MDDDLRDLLAAWHGDELDAERRAALLARVRADAALRQAFVDEIQMRSMVQAAQSAEPRWLALEDVLGAAPDEDALEDRVMNAVNVPAPQRRRMPWAGVAVLAGLIAAAAWLSRPPIELPPALGPVSPCVGVVVKVEDASWGGDGPHLTDGALLRCGPLSLRGGRVFLGFVNGVAMTIEGPADLDVLSENRVRFRRGKLRTRVPPGAEGFTVLGPGAAVVDLGTEFAVNVAADGTSEVMVFEGRAAVSVLNAAGHTLSSEECGGDAALVVDPLAGRIRGVAAEPSRFVGPPKLAVPALVLDPTYMEVVRAAAPWGYWRFGPRDGDVVRNAIAGRPSLSAVNGVRLLDGSESGPVAVFGAGKPDQRISMDGKWMPPRAGGYAIELWVLSEGFNLSTLVGLEPTPRTPESGHVALVELMGVSRELLHEACAIRYLDRWPPRRRGGDNAFSRTMYIPNRWHHIVAQRANGRLELYVNGNLAGEAPVSTEAVTTPCSLIVGRMKSEPDRDLNQIRPLVGRVGELAIYERALAVEEIRRHAQLGR